MQTLYREITHWHNAAKRLSKLELMASDIAWKGLQPSTAITIQQFLHRSTQQLVIKGEKLREQLQTAQSLVLQHQLRRNQ